jgi:hypothetical protein
MQSGSPYLACSAARTREPARWSQVRCRTVTHRLGGRNVIHGSRLPNRESATELRRLEDGREFRIFKRSFDPDRLARDLRDHGLDASFVETGEFFVYGLGRRA